MLLLLILINILSYVDRHMLPAFASQITADLELTRQQFGLLTGFAFVTVYALSGPLMGVMADRFNPSKVIAIGIVVWSLMTVVTGLAKNFLSILLPRMAIGVGEAVLHPSAAGILGKLFSPSQRATVFGLFFMGSQIGLGLAYWLAGTFGDQIGWRQMFYILGALGVLLAVMLVPFFGLTRHAARTAESAHGLQGQSVRSVLGELWAACTDNRNFRLAVLGMSVLHMLYASTQFMQLWLVADKGMAETEASSLYGSIFLLTAIPSSLLGGMAADWFCKRFATTRALFVSIVLLLSAPLLIMFRLTPPDSPLFLVGMGASVFMLAFPYGAMFSLVLDFAPANIQSTAAGFTMFIANVLVIGTGTFAIGYFADMFEVQAMAAPLTTALLASDVVAISAVLIYLNLHRSSRQQR
jgi:sugar phosphate permease